MAGLKGKAKTSAILHLQGTRGKFEPSPPRPLLLLPKASSFYKKFPDERLLKSMGEAD